MAVADIDPGRPGRPLVAIPGGAQAASRPADIRLPWQVTVYLICVVVPIGVNLGPLAMTALRGFLILMVIPLLVKLLTGKLGRIFWTDILFLLHMAWATAALFVNNPDQVVQQIGSVGVEFVGGYLVGRAYIRTPGAFLALCRRLVVLVLCTLPFSIHEALTGRPLIIEMIRRVPGIFSVAIVTIEGRMGFERVQSIFAHPIHYGLFCSVTFSLAFVALRGISSTGWRYLSSVVVGVCGCMALSSGALLAMVLQTGLIVWAGIFASVKQRWWLLVGLFAIAYVVVDILSNRTPLRVFMSYATFSAHNAYWRGIIFEWGMKNVWGSPYFGIGLNDWVRPWFMHSGSMDNFWLVMAVRYGIPGFLLLAVGYALGVLQIMRRNFDVDERLALIRRAWVFTFLGLSFTLCTVHVWTNVYSFVFFMFGAGMWLILEEPNSVAEQTVGLGPQAGRSGPALRRTGFVSTPHLRPATALLPRTKPGYTRFAVRPGTRREPN